MARIPVEPSAIASELGRVWREAALLDQALTGKTAPRVRMVLSNLIVLLSKESEQCAQFVDQLITAVAVEHPSRVFVLTLSCDARAELEAAVSSRCVQARSGSHVCTEEIYLRLSANAAGVARNLLLAHLAPDVPTVALLYGDAKCGLLPDSSPAAAQICGLADRVVYEGLLFANYTESEDCLLRTEALSDFVGRSSFGAKQEQGDGRIRDINWRRLQRWRALIAEQFDSGQAAQEIETISSVVLSSNVPVEELWAGHLPGGALCLAAWIAECLGRVEGPWDAHLTGDGIRLERTKDRSLSMQFEFFPSSTSGVVPQRLLSSVTFVFGSGFELQISHLFEKQAAEVIIRSGSAVSETVCEFSVRRVGFAYETTVALALQELIASEPAADFQNALNNSCSLGQAALRAVREELTGV